MSPRWGSTPRLTDWLTVSRNVTLTNWNSSCSVRGRYLYLGNREKWQSCSLQTLTRPHCSEFVVWALEHTDQRRENQAIYFSRRLKSLWVSDDVLQLKGWDIPFVNNVMHPGVTFERRNGMETPYRKDCSQVLAHITQGPIHYSKKWLFKYKF
jgi:hypothetical protein